MCFVLMGLFDEVVSQPFAKLFYNSFTDPFPRITSLKQQCPPEIYAP